MAFYVSPLKRSWLSTSSHSAITSDPQNYTRATQIRATIGNKKRSTTIREHIVITLVRSRASEEIIVATQIEQALVAKFNAGVEGY